MWKLWNKLFGWDYIYWRNFADHGVARVYRSPNDNVYYWGYKTTQLADRITYADQVIWLTCRSSKYLGENK